MELKPINFNNFSFVMRENEKNMLNKYQSSWTKYNLNHYKKAPQFTKSLRPSFIDSVKMIIHHTTKEIATVDNRNLMYGLMRLRGGVKMYKPICVKG